MTVPINYWAVIVAAVVNFGLGGLWYGPFFGKAWSALMKFTPETMAAAKKKGMAKSYITMLIGSLLMSGVLAYEVIFGSTYMQISGVSAGLQAGFWLWLGFVAPVTLGTILWEGKPWKLWFINAGYYLVSLLIMGTILSVWR